MTIKSRNFYFGKKKHTVSLEFDGYMYFVKVDEDIYKQTPNELFAVQTFNEI